MLIKTGNCEIIDVITADTDHDLDDEGTRKVMSKAKDGLSKKQSFEEVSKEQKEPKENNKLEN